MACWVFKGRGMGGDTTIYTFTGCFTKPSWGASVSGVGAQAPYDNGVALFNGWASQQNTLIRVFNQAELNDVLAGTSQYGSSCANCFTSLYNCVNGNCVESSNGIYATLEECQASCSGGTGCAAPNICVPPDYCPPGMRCLPDGEFSQIEGLSAALNNSACS